MFRISEFAQLARVSARQLRHYQQLALIEPEHTDKSTGYRYYSARQLPRLNRILSLRALGFSLDQVRRLIETGVSPEELRGMLEVRRAELEQALEAEHFALRQVEARIIQIEEQGMMRDYDVTLKPVAERPWVALRATFADFREAFPMLRRVANGGARAIRASLREEFCVVAHADFDDLDLEMEIGWFLTRPVNAPIVLPGGTQLIPANLPAIEQAAALVRAGPGPQIHLAYAGLGLWMETNGFCMDGPCREMFLEQPFEIPGSDDVVVEIQVPVRKIA